MKFSNINLNNHQCRFCLFNSEGISQLLYSHYLAIHPVTKSMDDNGTQILSQNNEIIAYLSYKHDKCCINNCVNSKASKINRNIKDVTPSICIRLKFGGDYESIQQYFDNKEFFESEKGIFICLDQFELNGATYLELINWIEEFGAMGTYKLKNLPLQKNKNLIILNRTPKPRERRVIIQKLEVKCSVTPKEQELLTKMEELASSQYTLVKQLAIEKSEKQSWKKIANVRKTANIALKKELDEIKKGLKRHGFEIQYKNDSLVVTSTDFSPSSKKVINDAKRQKMDYYSNSEDSEISEKELSEISENDLSVLIGNLDYDETLIETTELEILESTEDENESNSQQLILISKRNIEETIDDIKCIINK